jgi:hypothetical protein
MISEVLNALFLTYLATEYHLAASSAAFQKQSWLGFTLQPRLISAFIALIFINIFDRVSGAADLANTLLQGFFHAPKILLVILMYSACLYWDCRRIQPRIKAGQFARTLMVAFLQILPLYPLLAIAISFGFLMVINLFEFLHLRLELLNMPIYYGTLYGPFSLIYFKVKSRFLEERERLPMTL